VRVAEVQDRIQDAGAALIWVLEADTSGEPGTAESCEAFVRTAGGSTGWCVGDGQTEPDPGEFDESPFSRGRGFDIAVRRETMVIEFVTNHGTPSGNENLSADDIARAIEAL